MTEVTVTAILVVMIGIITIGAILYVANKED